MSTAAPVRGYVFDAYGTLFDVHSIVEVGREITADPQTLSATWRQKQLEYTWLRALMGRYEDFWAVTEAALRYAIRRLALTPSEAQIRRLMDAYLSLACFPEVKAALVALAPRPRAILSNGSPRMLEAAVASADAELGDERHGARPRALGRCSENLQAFARGLRTRAASPGHRGGGAPLRVIERMGRSRRQGVRISGRLVQPDPGTRGGARYPARRHDQPTRPASAVGVLDAAEQWKGVE